MDAASTVEANVRANGGSETNAKRARRIRGARVRGVGANVGEGESREA
jgi:hypothetical protein